MDIQNDFILHLEALAKITLTEEEREQLVPQLEEITEYFYSLQSLDTSGEEGEAARHCVLRPDAVQPSLTAEEVTSNAATQDGFFAVPQAVEG